MLFFILSVLMGFLNFLLDKNKDIFDDVFDETSFSLSILKKTHVPDDLCYYFLHCYFNSLKI